MTVEKMAELAMYQMLVLMQADAEPPGVSEARRGKRPSRKWPRSRCTKCSCLDGLKLAAAKLRAAEAKCSGRDPE